LEETLCMTAVLHLAERISSTIRRLLAQDCMRKEMQFKPTFLEAVGVAQCY